MEEKFRAIVNDSFQFPLNKNDLNTFDVISDGKNSNVIFNNKTFFFISKFVTGNSNHKHLS